MGIEGYIFHSGGAAPFEIGALAQLAWIASRTATTIVYQRLPGKRGPKLTFVYGLADEGPHKLSFSIIIFHLISLSLGITWAELLLVTVGILLRFGLHVVRQVLTGLALVPWPLVLIISINATE